MSTTQPTFDRLKSIVETLGALEDRLREVFSQTNGVKLVTEALLQELCPHSVTHEWTDFGDYHKPKRCLTCNTCHKELK
jgi:hypothetical protein